MWNFFSQIVRIFARFFQHCRPLCKRFSCLNFPIKYVQQQRLQSKNIPHNTKPANVWHFYTYGRGRTQEPSREHWVRTVRRRRAHGKCSAQRFNFAPHLRFSRAIQSRLSRGVASFAQQWITRGHHCWNCACVQSAFILYMLHYTTKCANESFIRPKPQLVLIFVWHIVFLK